MAHSAALSHWRRVAAEGAMLLCFGLIMAEIGPYGTIAVPIGTRLAYWLACIVGGGAIGIAIDETAGRRVGSLWRRIALTSLAMTPLVALLVWAVSAALIDARQRPAPSIGFLIQVAAICGPLMAFRALTWRPPVTVIETRTVIAPPLPSAEADFRRRLSARRRGARLIAIAAEDHYLRVHTDAGEELLAMRLGDALRELAGAHGLRTHRSWWVAADAIEAVRWRKGGGEATLASGLVAPISRTYAAAVKAAGWF